MRQDAGVDQHLLQQAIDHISLYLKEVEHSGVSAKRAVTIDKELEEGFLEKNFNTFHY